jgi:hypothetical protein
MKKTLRASEQDRDDLRQAREAWRQKQTEFLSERLVFVDE